MAKRKPKPKKKVDGTVYVLRFLLEGKIIYKVGATHRSARTRLLEIAGEMLDATGWLPKASILLEKRTRDAFKVEAEVLKRTEKHQYYIGIDCSGKTEFRDMTVDELTMVYNECIVKDYPATKQQLIEL